MSSQLGILLPTLHIVLNDSTAGNVLLTLKECGLKAVKGIQEHSEHCVLPFNDDLSIGSLLDIDHNPPKARILFWQSVLQRFPSFLEDIRDAPSIFESLSKKAREVIIYYGDNVQEILLLQRLAWYLHKTNIAVSEVTILDKHLNQPLQTNIAMLHPKMLKELYALKRSITPRRLRILAEEWEKIRNTPGVLRAWQNGSIEILPEFYFDNALLENIKPVWQSAAKIIGVVMGSTNIHVSEFWLRIRLNNLACKGEIELQGDLLPVDDSMSNKMGLVRSKHACFR